MSSIKNISMKLIIITIITMALLKLNDASNKRLCGKELTVALELICDNKYNGFEKKSIDVEDYYNDQYIEDELPYPYRHLPFLAKVRGGAIIPKVRRQRHGVSDECCKKPCSFKELSSYCKYPTDDRDRRSLF